VDEGKEILEDLLKRYWEGLKEPLHFFPESSWEYAKLRFAKETPAQVALEQGRKVWEGTEWSRGEIDDPYYQLCFGKRSIDTAFEESP
jgi:exodeoxyribonuclease V gamma subunit